MDTARATRHSPRPGAALLLCACSAYSHADVTLTAPGEVVVGANVQVGWEGAADPRDFITIVAIATPEGKYGDYQYARESPVTLVAPPQPGSYEIRYLAAAGPYPTLARAKLEVADAQATLSAPAEVEAGAEFAVQWTGPDNTRDFIGLVAADAPEGSYKGPYKYTSKGSPVTLRAPDAAGAYELRYMMGGAPHRTLGRQGVTVRGAGASINVAASIPAGSTFDIEWQGPDHTQDFITIVPAGSAAKAYDAYVYTARGNPAQLAAPEIPGDYEVRYLTGQSYDTLATVATTVTAVSATVHAPPSAPARDAVAVTWDGPGNPLDYVILLPVGSDNDARGNYASVTRGKELRIATPAEPGSYELRYVTGGRRITLGMRPIEIVPRPAPGRLRVVAADAAGPGLDGATVAVVLDASGSMLQRIDGERRIDIAKQAMTELVTTILPDTVAFTLRVFGHQEADSCRTDLEIPVGPLARPAAVAKIASVNAMNLAKTPIAESLQLVAADLAGRAGQRLIILVTDGEETCGGDPAGVIRELAASGTDVRVNIVGLAIDELMLQETFREWARLGHGQYFDAQDAAELGRVLKASVELPYAVLDAGGAVVATGTVNGPEVVVDAGTYQVVTQTEPVRRVESVVVEMERETVAALP